MNFDELAAAWDNDPKKIERAKTVAKEIISFIKPDRNQIAFEYGCGTGLLSFELKDSFKRITLADNSEGMIKVLQEKIQASGVNNFDPLVIDLQEEEIEIPKQDVVYTLMTLHHMADLDKTFRTFNSILMQNGYLCIADLVKEDGSFHGHIKDYNGHKGFDRKELTEKLRHNSLNVEYYNECFIIEKEVDNELVKYPVFLMICRKTGAQ